MQGRIHAFLATMAVLTLTWAVQGQMIFEPPIDYGIGPSPSGLTTADFDNNGLMDLAVVSNDLLPRVTFLMNYKDTGLVQESWFNLPKGSTDARIIAADMNGDNRPDLVLLYPTLGKVEVFVYSDFAGYVSVATVLTGIQPHGLVVGDVNGDGTNDIVVANTGSNTVNVFMNYGKPKFKTLTLKTGSQPMHVALADLSGNKGRFLKDIIVTQYGDNSVSIFRNKGGEQFTMTDSLYVGTSKPDGLVVGDFNQDGLRDIAVALSGRAMELNYMAVLYNYGGTFSRPVKYQTWGEKTVAVGTGDFNGDGKLDIVTADCYSDTLTILGGRIDGQYQLEAKLLSSGGPDEVLVVDLDGDGDLDLVSLNIMGKGVTVFYNACIP